MYGYAGAFVLGLFFPYAFTVAPATVSLYMLGEILNPLLIAFIGAIGATISNYLIFRFVRDELLGEMKTISKELHIKVSARVRKSKILKIIIPIIAGLIVASPLPDEIGIALFGAIKYEPRRFVLCSYILSFFLVYW
jgi:glucose-6-phosphate-specific signal transduction histidine kinase